MGVLHTKHNKRLKTLGPQAARFVAELHERGKTLFVHADVREITSLQYKSARNFVASLVQRGIGRGVQEEGSPVQKALECQAGFTDG